MWIIFHPCFTSAILYTSLHKSFFLFFLTLRDCLPSVLSLTQKFYFSFLKLTPPLYPVTLTPRTPAFSRFAWCTSPVYYLGSFYFTRLASAVSRMLQPNLIPPTYSSVFGSLRSPLPISPVCNLEVLLLLPPITLLVPVTGAFLLRTIEPFLLFPEQFIFPSSSYPRCINFPSSSLSNE